MSESCGSWWRLLKKATHFSSYGHEQTRRYSEYWEHMLRWSCSLDFQTHLRVQKNDGAGNWRWEFSEEVVGFLWNFEEVVGNIQSILVWSPSQEHIGLFDVWQEIGQGRNRANHRTPNTDAMTIPFQGAWNFRGGGRSNWSGGLWLWIMHAGWQTTCDKTMHNLCCRYCYACS